MAVPYADVLLSNTSLRAAGSGVVAVFVGATAGIGLGALKALTKHTTSPTIFIVGRSATRLEVLIRNELRPLSESGEGADATFVPVVVEDLTLVEEAARAVEEIAERIGRVDLLVMSPGYLDFSHDVSPEGVDRLTAIRYYSRMRFVTGLEKQLRAAPGARVVSVLAAGMEGKLIEHDLLLEKNWSAMNAATAAGTMTTLFLEEFAKREGNERIVCCHVYPGWVGDTGQRVGEAFPGWLRWLLGWVITPVMKLVGYTSEEAGERVLFAATSGRFRRLREGMGGEGTLVQKGVDGRLGSGVYLVQADSSVKTLNEALKKLREDGAGRKVYEHTTALFDRIARQ